MKFVSTRDNKEQKTQVDFATAILNCMPEDGGLYVPSTVYDLRKWILYVSENTSFANLAGTLTLALINEEFSPIICEAIATKAFTFVPEVHRLTENLWTLELYHTPTGSHKDFGIFYLVNAIETLMIMKQSKAVFLDASYGELGASLAKAINGKTHTKAIVLYPKGQMRGLKESDLFCNGGNIIAIQVLGSMADCHDIIRLIYQDRTFIQENTVTVANTANIGRLFPQSFFYTYAFSRLKRFVTGDIYYALSSGNYSNVVAGLYGWQLSLPTNGFIIPTTQDLKLDAMGKCCLLDSLVPLTKRPPCDSADPCNLERLENVFSVNSLILKDFIFPEPVSTQEEAAACKELFMKYNLYADRMTSKAFAAAKKHHSYTDEDGSSIVLVERDTPALDRDYIQRTLGEAPKLPQNILQTYTTYTGKGMINVDASDKEKASRSIKDIIATFA